MRQCFLRALSLGTGIALAIAFLLPLSASAQSDLDVSEAESYIGNWQIAIDSEFGPFTMELELEDQSGKVAAAIGVPEMGGPMQEVTDVVRTGEGLTMTWELDAQGQFVEAIMILSMDGDNLSTLLSVADGQFTAAGVGTRAES
jgi:hypothetical protein